MFHFDFASSGKKTKIKKEALSQTEKQEAAQKASK
jgi:hypothetical protein